MDSTDVKILGILQEDASMSVAEIAARVNLSQTPCWRRIQRLEASGVIRRRVALLDPAKIGMDISVFVAIETNDHSKE
jgi:Lrp/AsnC family transcriptional regulator